MVRLITSSGNLDRHAVRSNENEVPKVELLVLFTFCKCCCCNCRTAKPPCPNDGMSFRTSKFRDGSCAVIMPPPTVTRVECAFMPLVVVTMPCSGIPLPTHVTGPLALAGNNGLAAEFSLCMSTLLSGPPNWYCFTNSLNMRNSASFKSSGESCFPSSPRLSSASV